METFEALQTIPYSKSLRMSLRACEVFVYHFLHGVLEALCEVSIGRGATLKSGGSTSSFFKGRDKANFWPSGEILPLSRCHHKNL